VSGHGAIDLRRQRDRFLPFAFAAADLYLEVDCDGVVLDSLGASRECLGLAEDAVIGRLISSLVALPDRLFLERLLARSSAGRRFGPLDLESPLGRGLTLRGYSIPQAQDRLYLVVTCRPLKDAAGSAEALAADDPARFVQVAHEVLDSAARAGRDLSLTVLRLNGAEDWNDGKGTVALLDLGRRFVAFLRAETADEGAAIALSDDRFAVLHGA